MDGDESRRASQADEDRRVILARRQRFIALALAGLGGASSACAGRELGSESPEQADADGGAEEQPQPTEGVDPIDEPPPRPPKELDPPRRKWTGPQACLRIELPEEPRGIGEPELPGAARRAALR